MANSKELAEQAFSLLSDALRNSEDRVAELDAELKRKRMPRNKLEEQANVLSHRLETTEADRDKWRQEAGQFEELLDNERSKVEQLRKKLEIAESGPDKVEKKEVNFWRQRAEQFDEEIQKYKDRLTTLRNELRDKTAEADRAAEEELQADIDLSESMESARKELEALRETIRERDSQIAEVSAELEIARGVLTGHERQLDELVASQSRHEADGERLKEEHEQALSALREQHEQALADLREHSERAHDDQVQQSEQALGEAARQHDEAIAELRRQLDGKDAEIQRLTSTLAEQRENRPELEHEIGELKHANQSLEESRQALEQQLQSLGEQHRTLEERYRSVEEQHQSLEELHRALEEQLRDADGKASAARAENTNLIETLNNLISQRDEKIAGLEQALAEAVQEKAAADEKARSLEEALAEERECTVDLSQLANERREEIEQVVEKLEEIEERYEEAKWKLGKAAHFEKLVVKRKKLISDLIAEIRTKIKANTALKAGIDGLRTFKATSERNQQKLLARADRLSDELAEARETIVVQQNQSAAAERAEIEEAQARVAELEDRVRTQVELIESLESELKTIKLTSPAHDSGAGAEEIERLRAQLDDQQAEIGRKNSAIEALEADIDGLQIKLGKLRGSESETMRLRVVQEQDQNTIVELEQELETVKRQLAEASAAGSPRDVSTGEKDKEIQLLRRRLQDQDREIGRLSEALTGWQKKYEFLAADPPAAYQADVKK